MVTMIFINLRFPSLSNPPLSRLVGYDIEILFWVFSIRLQQVFLGNVGFQLPKEKMEI